MKLDVTDRKILKLLQQDGRLSNAEIAEQVALSPSPCLRRLRRLEQEGIIEGYQTQLNRQKIDLGMTVFVQIKMHDHHAASVKNFEQAIHGMDAVITASTVSGSADYLLEVVASDLEDYDRVVSKLQELKMVREIESNFALRRVKTAAPLPLKRLSD
ncbi:Lrp/AsnC family transcriptional regulator [Amphritea balenae]|uniref:Lrp/AsnC family transcriptional regulator n=1 Tax=Amphritea balenae TaxID=452629 RepID=A0A3P1SWM5_9GAMM|nr:Lrp/AsnC family transcriptional regulator [Amphritea balenae]RRD01632.1 Lrp/AsnC family transcriptional regulator [Amphritea balenae]GGK55424.1 AsnC family transcriptional regulator [Amphritea balenae]